MTSQASDTPPVMTWGSRDDRKAVELGEQFAPKFDDQGLIPVVAVDHQSNEVLMLAYMNDQALSETLRTGRAVYFSRSRSKLWRKGEESGNVQQVKQVLIDCDQDTLVLKVEQVGGACCHNGYRACFYRAVDTENLQDDAAPGLRYVEADRVFDPDQVYGKK